MEQDRDAIHCVSTDDVAIVFRGLADRNPFLFGISFCLVVSSTFAMAEITYDSAADNSTAGKMPLRVGKTPLRAGKSLPVFIIFILF
jgi:hypothetical protein